MSARHLNEERSSYRVIYFGIGLVVVAAVVLGIAFGGGSEPSPLPAPIESLLPRPNDRALSQAILEVDLEGGYRASIYLDGFLLPENEVVFVEPTGVHRWQPSPLSVVVPEWTPGMHEVKIVWDSLGGLPSPGEFTWSFRIQ